jgi:hypothetical protein
MAKPSLINLTSRTPLHPAEFRGGQALRNAAFRVMGSSLPHPPAPSPCNGEGEKDADQVPSPRVETYAQHTRDYRGEVKHRI